MKQLIVIAIILTSVVACGGQLGDNEFLVKGNVKNAEGKTLFLSQLSATGMTTIDSVTLEKGGEFRFTGNTPYPDFYSLRIGPNDYVTMIIDSANVISISADANDFAKTFDVEGSADTKLLIDLDKQIQKTIKRQQELKEEFQDKQFNSDFDTAKIFAEFKQVVEDQRDFSKKFIDDNLTSLASIVALSQRFESGPSVLSANVKEDFVYFEKVDSALFAIYPTAPAVIQMREGIKRFKSEMALQSIESKTYNVGDTPPDIALSNPKGKEITLYSLRGKYVLLDFWAGWCGPCRAESPNLVKAYNKFNDKGFDIYQVSLDKEKSAWENAISADGLAAWHHVSDLKFWQSPIARQFSINSIPANFLLDPEGKIVAVNLRGALLENKLGEIFK